jgi:hypothetical protein
MPQTSISIHIIKKAMALLVYYCSGTLSAEMSSSQKHVKNASKSVGRKLPETDSTSATLSQNSGNKGTTDRQPVLECMREREAPLHPEDMDIWLRVAEDALSGRMTVFMDQDLPFDYFPTVLDVVGNDARGLAMAREICPWGSQIHVLDHSTQFMTGQSMRTHVSDKVSLSDTFNSGFEQGNEVQRVDSQFARVEQNSASTDELQSETGHEPSPCHFEDTVEWVKIDPSQLPFL